MLAAILSWISIPVFFSICREGSIKVKFQLLLKRLISSSETVTFQGTLGTAFVSYLNNNPGLVAKFNIDVNSINVVGKWHLV